jgi:hypothetical protein
MKKSEPATSLSEFTVTPGLEWPENMRPKKAAEYLGLSQAFLDRARCSGTGPKFVRVSRTCILYRKVDLDSFLASRLFTSTAEVDRRGTVAHAAATGRDYLKCTEGESPIGNLPRRRAAHSCQKTTNTTSSPSKNERVEQ